MVYSYNKRSLSLFCFSSLSLFISFYLSFFLFYFFFLAFDQVRLSINFSFLSLSALSIAHISSYRRFDYHISTLFLLLLYIHLQILVLLLLYLRIIERLDRTVDRSSRRPRRRCRHRSRQIKPGCVFVCINSNVSDRYI